MENIFRIAFWTFALSGILQAHTAAIKHENFDIKGLKRDLEQLPNHVTCNLDVSLYTPTREVECLGVAFECVIKELLTASKECDDESKKIVMAVDDLYNMIDKDGGRVLSQSNSTECVCERWPSSPWKKFLYNSISLLELYHINHMTASS